MTEDGRTTGMVALCGLSPSLFLVWGNQDAQLDAVVTSLRLGSGRNFVESHPKRDEAALRMGHPILWLGAAFGFVLRTNEAEKQVLRCAQDDNGYCAWDDNSSFFNLAIFEEKSHENLSGK